jgi:uncharacterized protein (DUF697 family)
MSRIKELTSIWSTIKEIDLRPVRDDALQEVRLTIVGRPGSGRHALADALRNDPHHPGVEASTPVLLLDLKPFDDVMQQAGSSHLLILLVPVGVTDIQEERLLLKSWSDIGRKALVLINTAGIEIPSGKEVGNDGNISLLQTGWGLGNALVGSLADQQFLLGKFAREVIERLPDQMIALGRQFPLLRQVICNQLISDTCFSNGAYAFSTGLAEIVPVLNVPLNLTDMIVLSKTQAFLVYKLGLTLGMSTRWQDYSREFGGVLGSGFFWRQVARLLVGLIPAWGIAPKVAVSYAGTYVAGHAVLQWYLTGRHIGRLQIRQLYRQSFGWGRKLADRMDKDQPRLAASQQKSLAKPRGNPFCSKCGKKNARTARFCQYCGNELA